MKLVHIGGEPKHLIAQLQLFGAVWPYEMSWRMLDFWAHSPLAKQFPSGTFVDQRYFRSGGLLRDIRIHDVVIIHGMDALGQAVLRSEPDRSTRIIWSAFGYEYQWAMEAALGPLLLPRTKAWESEWSRSPRGVVNRIRQLSRGRSIAEIGGRLVGGQAVHEQVLNDYHSRFDVIAMDPGSLRLVRMTLPDLTNLVWENQFVVVEKVEPKPSARGRILVGNSATMTNNHLDLLPEIIGADFVEAVLPLNYGNRRYGDHVAVAYERALGEGRTRPIFDWVIPSHWQSMVQDSSSVLLNHRRQQAFGTALLALSGGSRVYLRRENPIAESLKLKGCLVHDIESEVDRSLLSEPLAGDELKRNLVAAHSLASREAGEVKVNRLVRMIAGM